MTASAFASSTIQSEPSPAGEAALVARLRAGDESAFEELVRTRGARMLAAARRLLGSEDDAQDAVQEALVSAWKSMGRFHGDSTLSTWLHRITVNFCLMKLRTRKRRRERSIDDLLPTFLDDGHRRVSPTPARGPALDPEELRALVRECIDELDAPHREVILLRDLEELDTRETANVLGISEAAVKTRLHRARQALRTLLEPRLSDPIRG